MYDGMLQHAKQVTMDTEIAGGAYWHSEYDPLDPLTFEDAHSVPPAAVQALVGEKKAFPVLVSQASIYPGGRIMPGHEEIALPVLIGKGMASDTKLEVGDVFTIRWLDADRTYDANEGTVVHIMDTENFKLDMGHIWIPLNKAQAMLAMEGEATYVTYEKGIPPVQNKGDWIPRDINYLVQDMEAIIEADKPGAQVMYMVLLALAAMGIFNAQEEKLGHLWLSG